MKKIRWTFRLVALPIIAVSAVFAFASPAQSADRATLIAPCASVEAAQAVVNTRLVELQEAGRTVWVVKDISVSNPGAAAVTFNSTVWLAHNHPCAFLRSTVDHEWAHIQQNRKYPGRAAKAYGDSAEAEIIADCVAFVLGNPDYSPYLRERGYGCTPYEIEAAKVLAYTHYVTEGN